VKIANEIKPGVVEPLEHRRLLALAEDIEFFRRWWEDADSPNDMAIRHGSSVLRRLLVEGTAGRAWRKLGFEKTPTVQGPDLLGLCQDKGVKPALGHAVAGGIRLDGVDWALIGAFRLDNPTTGISASADAGFAVLSTFIGRDALNTSQSPLDHLVERTWYLHDYLRAPGALRRGQLLSRSEVIKHMANDMGGVHLEKSNSEVREFLIEAERNVFIKTKKREIRGLYIEILAIGQAIGRSVDMQRLAGEIRNRFA
jgi:hypothetical protein